MYVITTHLNADFDGLASMVAARKLYPDAALVFPGGAQDHVRAFLAVHDLGLTKLKDVDLAKITGLVLVDTQEPERVGPFGELCLKPEIAVHVFDHHCGEESEPPYQAAHRTVDAVGATTTLLVERLQADKVAITPFEATVLALGIYEETGSLAFTSTTPRDLEAAACVLRAGADLTVVCDTLRNHLEPELIALLNDLLQSAETYYLEGWKVLLVSSTYDRYHGDLAEAVHKLAELEGVDAVVAAMALDEKVQVIGRSRRPEINVARLAQAFGGGGHPEAASASVKGQTVVEVKERLASLLTERHRPTLLAKDVMTKPVISIGAGATMADAESTMTKYQINVLPVLDGRERYCGLLSRETVQRALFHKLGRTQLANLIQEDAYSAEPGTPFRDIEGHMIERNQRFVPILEKGKVVGVITRTDLLRTLHDDVLASARARAKGEEPPPFSVKRNLRARLEERLPGPIVSLLRLAGRVAQRKGVSAYVVGGFVRDLLLGRSNLDVDLVIEGDGIAFARAYAQDVEGTVKVHERFGTAIVISPDGYKVDVATARTEYYEYPTALPTVEQSSIKKDLYRRDFTINALAIRLNEGQFGELIDFYGGQRDLNEKTIRVLHSLSFVEDPTRVFRAVRFEQRFGFRLGRETLSLVKGAIKMELFHRLSAARLAQELVLLLSEEEPPRGLARLGELGLLKFVHRSLAWSPQLAATLKSVEDALKWYRLLYLDRRMEPWLVYFMALADAIPAKAVGELLRRLRVPGRHAEHVRQSRFRSGRLLERLGKRSTLSAAEVYRSLEGLSDEVIVFLMAKAKQEPVKRRLSAFLTTYQHVKPALSGDDLKDLGLKPGPMFRKLLDRLRDARLNGQVRTEDDERALVRRLAKL